MTNYDYSEPLPCDREVYNNGEVIFVGEDIPKEVAERWVKMIARLSEQRVDWHYAGGRVVVKALGDRAAAEWALDLLLPELRRLRERLG